VAGECGVIFQLVGPSFTVGLGTHAALEALAAAATLVRAGDADRVVVVAVDDIAETAAAIRAGAPGHPALSTLRAGAVALVVSADPSDAIARIGAIDLILGVGKDTEATPAPGHLALLPLTGTGAVPPSRLRAASRISAGPTVVASIALEPVAKTI
jgi:hypothetical protein